MIEGIHGRVMDAAHGFEGRWTLRSLERVDPELHEALLDQQRMFDAAIVRGGSAEIDEHGAAMIRGWAAAVRRMVEAGAPDDSYMLGWDQRSGLRVAVTGQLAAHERVRQVHGHQVIVVTPDEVATLLAAQQELLRIKGAFVGCEVVGLYPTEPKVDAA
jgi:hypothetical protein